MKDNAVRVLFCWSDISGYMAACWRELLAIDGIDLFVLAYQVGSGERHIAFSNSILQGINHRLLSSDEWHNEALIKQIESGRLMKLLRALKL